MISQQLKAANVVAMTTALQELNEKANKVFPHNFDEAVSVCFFVGPRMANNTGVFIQAWFALFSNEACLNDNLSRHIFEGSALDNVILDMEAFLDCRLDIILSLAADDSFETNGFGD